MESIQLVNQPPHFISAILATVSFLVAVYSKNDTIKIIARRVLYVAILIASVTGIYLVATLPMSIYPFLKGIFASVVVLMALQIVKGKGTKKHWIIMLSCLAVGGSIAYFLIV